MKSDGSDITGINNEGAIVLVNDIFQVLGEQNNFTLSESTGITSITFDGTARNITNDVNPKHPSQEVECWFLLDLVQGLDYNL